MIETPGKIQGQTHSLSPTDLIDLFTIRVFTDAEDAVFRITESETVTWSNGFVWQNTAMLFSGARKSSSGEVARPKLNLPISSGFLYYVNQGFMEGALVTRHQIHPEDLALYSSGESASISESYAIRSQWFVSRVTSATNQVLSLELRGFSDGNKFKLPSRRFSQPEFPFVSL